MLHHYQVGWNEIPSEWPIRRRENDCDAHLHMLTHTDVLIS